MRVVCHHVSECVELKDLHSLLVEMQMVLSLSKTFWELHYKTKQPKHIINNICINTHLGIYTNNLGKDHIFTCLSIMCAYSNVHMWRLENNLWSWLSPPSESFLLNSCLHA